MIHTHERVFLDLLRAGMWGTPTQEVSGFNEWDMVAAVAKEQSVMGVVGKVLLTDDNINFRLSPELRLKVKQLTFSYMHSHTLLNKTLVTVVRALNEKGIESVLLKGQGLARYYPQPDLRQCGDIDLYVGCENSFKTYEILAPMAVRMQPPLFATRGKHYDVVMERGVKVEVHRLTDNYVSSRLNRIFKEASFLGTNFDLVPFDFAGTTVYTPADDFNAFYIFSHLFQHFMVSGIGLRQFCDWMMFLHARKDHINHDYLKTLLQDMGMMKPWQVFGCVLVRELGLPEEEFPFYDKSHEKKVEKILRRVLDEGNFGKERKIYKRRGTKYFIKKTVALLSYIGRSFSIMLLFPRHTVQYFISHIYNGFTSVTGDIAECIRKIRYGG
jgi:hypothetical protein